MLQTKNIGIQTAIEEVKRMSMSERMRARYEAHMKELRDRRAIEAYEREQGYDQGYAQGVEQGIERGGDRVNCLNCMLLEQNRSEDMIRAMEDTDYQKKLFEEFHI